MNLPADWSRTWRVWWEFLWRSMILGIPLSLFYNSIQSSVSPFMFFIISTLLSLMAGTIVLKWMTGKKFGDFRLLLVEANDYDDPPTAVQPSWELSFKIYLSFMLKSIGLSILFSIALSIFGGLLVLLIADSLTYATIMGLIVFITILSVVGITVFIAYLINKILLGKTLSGHRYILYSA